MALKTCRSIIYWVLSGNRNYTLPKRVNIVGGRQVAALDIQGTVLPFPLNRALRIWVSIDDIVFDSTVVTVKPNETDTVGAELADLRLIPPGLHASFLASFCRPGTVTFQLAIDETAAALTVADALISIIRVVGAVTPARVFAFANALNAIPLYASAMNHITAAIRAASAGHTKVAFQELSKAGVDLARLAFNRGQRQQLVQAYKQLGLTITLGVVFRALVGAPLTLIQIFADVITFGIETGFGSEPIIIQLRAPL